MSRFLMDTTLRQADGHHKKAKLLYREVLLNQVRKAGDVANLAARVSIPIHMLQKALDENSQYLPLRNMAHEVMRKLGGE